MDSILKKAETFVLNCFNDNLNPNFVYHNFFHTQFVVSKINEIIQGEDLTETEEEILLLAGWFHDIGYTINREKHEDHSISIAKDFLTQNKYDKKNTENVIDCIATTKLNEKPTSLLEKIMQDADYSHLASANYVKISNQLRTEFENTGCRVYSDQEWLEENIKVFNEHKYYTKYANLNWNSNKNENLIILKKNLIKQLKKKNKSSNNILKDNKLEKSVETLFKLTSANHLKLSYIADRKANILLSVNAIILSITLSHLISKFDNPSNYFLIYPVLIFITFSVISIILSVIVTRPNITSGKFTKEDVANKEVNLLFFGNFHKMELIDFKEGLREMINDKEYMFSSLTQDLYFLGKVLDRKYKILRWNYNIFMFGIIISLISFIIAYKSLR